MRSGVNAAMAIAVLLISVVWGFVILRADVYASVGPENLVQCGTVGMITIDRRFNSVGGEVQFDQQRFEDQCMEKARRAVRPAAVPLVLGVGSVVFLGLAFAGVIRRSKAAGRSAGPLVG